MKRDIFCMVVGVLLAVVGIGGYLFGRYNAGKSVEQVKAQAQAELDLRYGKGEALVVMADLPAGSVLEKRVLGLQTIPLSGLSGRVFHVEDLQQVVGRRLAFDLKRGNVLLKTDLLPQQ